MSILSSISSSSFLLYLRLIDTFESKIPLSLPLKFYSAGLDANSTGVFIGAFYTAAGFYIF
jgi:hypothetical protein